MARKQPAKPEQSAEEEELVRRVDAMMGSEPADGTPKAAPADAKKNASTSAPVLPAALLKKIKTADATPPREKVIKIDHNPTPNPAPAKPEPVVASTVATPEASPAPASSPPPPPAAVPQPTDQPAPIEDPEKASVNLEDAGTDLAVDDIVAHEGDTLLALEDIKSKRGQEVVVSKGPGFKANLRSFFTSKKFVVILVIILVIFAVPVTRYKLLGLVIKKSVTINVVDTKTATPVSSALVQLGSASGKTNADGQVVVKVGLGQRTLTVSKQYYSTSTSKYFVGLKTGTPATVKLTATGRLVPVTVFNTISGKPVANVLIVVHGTSAKTNAKGQANIALPTSTTTDSASLTLPGYNTAKVAITVTNSVVKINSFTLTPAGQVYFLSNATGTLDVVKANLDGTGRKTILEGTGKEDVNNTSLLASRDWRYLVLRSRRDTAQPALYLIDTSTDKITEFDDSNNAQTLIGWYGHDFMYDLVNSSAPASQNGREAIKSYDADNLQLNQLDANQAGGAAQSVGYQTFSNFYILNNQLVYTVQWITSYSPGATFDLSGKTDTIRAVQPNGQNKKDYQSFPATTTGSMQAALYQPQAIYYAIYDNGTNATTYYEYEDQAVKPASIDPDTFNQVYPTYLLSPAGTQTFWTELRDGKNTLFTGDTNAANKKTIASASDYAPYGWYSDSYVLVSKNGSELYIMPASGLSTGQQPLKITDYYKPAQNFQGYGYGYGGL